MTVKQALRFVEIHGIVLEASRGPVPNLAEAIVGEPIRGSWWAHPKGRLIFGITRAVRSSPDVLVCRLIEGRITYVHRRLWPALVRLADRIGKKRLAAIREEHTSSGFHRVVATPFARWASHELRTFAKKLKRDEAIAQLGDWFKAK